MIKSFDEQHMYNSIHTYVLYVLRNVYTIRYLLNASLIMIVSIILSGCLDTSKFKGEDCLESSQIFRV
jgi:hypothetical protein